MRTANAAAIAMFAVAGAARLAGGQSAIGLRSGVVSTFAEAPAAPPPSDSVGPIRRQLDRIPVSGAALASLIVPGLGQARLHRDRFVAYMAAEAFLLLELKKNRDEQYSNEMALRAIARDVARRNFPGTHPDSVWQYYEKMETYLESGFFSRATSGPTVPEIDEGTYNGQQWLLARQVFGLPLDEPNPTGAPDYARALAYYESRAIPLAYGWSWDNAQLEKDLFVRAIQRRNDAGQRATLDLIALIANHLISSIDAFSAVRVMQASNSGIRVSASVPIR